MQRRVAYCEVPKLAGVYTFAVSLSEPLAKHGYDLRLVGVGPLAKSDYAHSLAVLPADVLAPDTDDLTAQREAYLRWLRDEAIDIVMISGSETEQRLIPALPPDIRVVSVVNNATRGHYRVATAHHDRIHRLVCLSPRLGQDIVDYARVPEHKVRLIPYGIDVRAFRRNRAARRPGPGKAEPMRVLYFGRMCDSAKGIFLIPRILAHLEKAGVPFHLTVIGDGPDAPRFLSLIEQGGFADRCTYRDMLRYDRVADELSRHDVMVMPSRHEGLGLVLLESMAAGCVPIASRLKGVTDYVISDEGQGVLCRVGRADEFAAAIAALAGDRARLSRMADAATARVEAEFTDEQMASRYAELFDTIMNEPALAPSMPVVPTGRLRPAVQQFSASCRRAVPVPVKNAVRTVCERAGWTV